MALLQRAAERPVHAYLLVGPARLRYRRGGALVRGGGHRTRRRPHVGPRVARTSSRRDRDRPGRQPDSRRARAGDHRRGVQQPDRGRAQGDHRVRGRAPERGRRQQAPEDARGTAGERAAGARHRRRRPAAADDPFPVPARRLREPRGRERSRACSPRPGCRRSAPTSSRGLRADASIAPRALDGRLAGGARRVRRRRRGTRRFGERGGGARRLGAGSDAGRDDRARHRAGRGGGEPHGRARASRAIPDGWRAPSCDGSPTNRSERTATRGPSCCSRASPRSRPSTATRWPARTRPALNVDRPLIVADARAPWRRARRVPRRAPGAHRAQPERDAAPRASPPASPCRGLNIRRPPAPTGRRYTRSPRRSSSDGRAAHS